jgi:sugar phosphate isomerase/epimerase
VHAPSDAAATLDATRPPLSLQLYTVRDAFAADPRGTLRRVADLGLRNVEPFGLVAAVDGLVEPMAELGLAAPTSHVAFVDGGLEAALAAAERLRVHTIIEPYIPEERWTTRPAIAAIAASLNDAARRAADRGIAIGYHNHWWELETRIDGVTALEILVDLLDDAVVLELDTYWCAVGGADPVAMLGRLGDRVVALHIKDGPITLDTGAQQPAGSGRMPIPGILAAAPGARPVLEFDAYAGDLFEGIGQGIAFVRGHGATL